SPSASPPGSSSRVAPRREHRPPKAPGASGPGPGPAHGHPLGRQLRSWLRADVAARRGRRPAGAAGLCDRHRRVHGAQLLRLQALGVPHHAHAGLAGSGPLLFLDPAVPAGRDRRVPPAVRGARRLSHRLRGLPGGERHHQVHGGQMVRVPARGAALSPPPAGGAPEPGEASRPPAGKRRWHLLAALVAVLVLAAGFARDFHLPGLYMDSINPEYMAVLALVAAARPDTPVQVLPGNLIAGRYPVLAGSYYHGPLQYYVALPVYALLGTDLTAARVVQLAYAVLVLLAMALVLAKARVAPGFAAGAPALLALDPAFVLTFKTQAYNVTWPLAWLFLGIATVEHWASRRRPPAWRESLGAGLFAGIAFFCYFVHLFFLPALAWYLACQLRATSVRDGKRMAGVF